MTERGENVEDLIDIKLSQDASGEMTYDDASREVVAEAMTDILPDAEFVETLANKHKTVFEKLLERLRDFLSELRTYFKGLAQNRSREANALKEQVGDSIKYVEGIVKLFDKVAVEAVENYQSTVATEDGSPVYETFENRTPVVPYDRKALKQRQKEAEKIYRLTEIQSRRLTNYVACAGFLNEKMLYENISEDDRRYIAELQQALKKFPTFSGRTYRNLKFKDVQSYNNFLKENAENETVTIKAFTSTSKTPNGYPLFGKYVVHMVLDGVSGRDIADTYGIPRQQEVLYLPGTRYIVNRVTKANDGKILIFVKETSNDGKVQVDEGNYGGYDLESVRNGGGTGSVPQRKGNDMGRFHGDRGGTGNDGGIGESEVRESHKLTDEPYISENGYVITDNAELGSERQALDGVDEEKEQEQSRGYLDDEYSTDGVHWLYEVEGIDNGDIRFVWETVANITKRNYKGYIQTVDGEYIADNENKIFFINADFRNPTVSRVIVFADSFETNMFEAKERIRYAKGDETRHREALRVIEISKGEGYAIEYGNPNSSSYERQDRRGEGSDSRGNTQQTKVREWHFDTEQEQGRTSTLTDAEILSVAAENRCII